MSKCTSIANGLPFCGHKGEQTKLSLGFRITAIVLGILAITAVICALLGVPGVSQMGTAFVWTLFTVGVLLILTAAAIKCLKNEPVIEEKPVVNSPQPVSQPQPPSERVSEIVTLCKKKHTSHALPQNERWGKFPRVIWEKIIIPDLALNREEGSLHNLAMTNSYFASLMEPQFQSSCQQDWPKNSKKLTHSSWSKQHAQLSEGWVVSEAAQENRIQKRDSLIKGKGFGPSIASESQLFIVKNSNEINSYDLSTLKLQRTLFREGAGSVAQLYLSGAKLISVHNALEVPKGVDVTTRVTIWDTESGTFLKEIDVKGRVGCSNMWQNKLIVAIDDPSSNLGRHPLIEIWDIDDSKCIRVNMGVDDHLENIIDIQCIEDKIISRDPTNTVCAWDMSGQKIDSYMWKSGLQRPTVLELIGNHVVMADGCSIQLLAKSSGNVKEWWGICKNSQLDLKPLIVSVNKHFLVATHATMKTIAVYDMQTFKKLHDLQAVPMDSLIKSHRYCLKIVGKTLVVATHRNLKVWNMRTGKCLATLEHRVMAPTALSIDKNRIIVRDNRRAEVFDIGLQPLY